MSFSGLEGVKRKPIKGIFVAKSVNGFMKGLCKSRVCSAAGDEGCITVWKRDDGKYMAAFSRYLINHSIITRKSKSSMKPWLKLWLPKIDQWC